jgi:hypothetical protein
VVVGVSTLCRSAAAVAEEAPDCGVEGVGRLDVADVTAVGEDDERRARYGCVEALGDGQGCPPEPVSVHKRSTEESGHLLAISVKPINFVDLRTKNFQKNLTNRRGDMLFESITLHRRFPYAVLAGFLILDSSSMQLACEH